MLNPDEANLEVFENTDGSKTLFNPMLNETYHSRHGAIAEGLHVFIEAGLKAWINENRNTDLVRIFEMGFGTGLNALLTLQASMLLESQVSIQYTSIESRPLTWDLVSALNYQDSFDEALAKTFENMHQVSWNQWQALSPQFTLKKIQTTLNAFRFEPKAFDLIYFDAFAPDRQPELWTQSVFEQLYETLDERGILVTYSAKGEVRRSMQAAGFNVERLPGPPYKRHMLRASKGGIFA